MAAGGRLDVPLHAGDLAGEEEVGERAERLVGGEHPRRVHEGVAVDREAVTRVYTSPAVMAAIQKRGIRLVSYKDVKEGR